MARAGRSAEPMLAAVTFVIGVGVMAVEITASRLLAPYFGASMFVWTSLIVTVLVALSFGYWFGGRAAERGHGTESVGLALVGAAASLLFGTSVIPNFSSAVSGMVTMLSSASIALFLGSLAVTLAVFALPVFLMAASGPILLKAWSASGDIGRISGRYFAVSTVGSVIGTVAPTLVLVPAFGAKATMMIVSFLFFACGACLLPKRLGLAALAVVVPASLFVLLRDSAPSDVVMERESPYQLIRVAEDAGGRRSLIFNEGSGTQSVYLSGERWTGMYFDYFAAVPFLRPSAADAPRRVALLGLAGGSIARSYRALLPPGDRTEIVGVEIDPAVIDTARKYFALDDAGVDVVNADARTFLAAADRPFDAILVDAYSVQLYIPPHLATREFFSLARSRLKPGGVLVANVNAASAESPLLVALVNSVAAEFAHVTVLPIPDAWNRLVIASDEPFDPYQAFSRLFDELPQTIVSVAAAYDVAFDPDAPVFVDDKAPVEFMTDAMIVAEAFK